MGFRIPSEDDITSVGYVTTNAYNAREIAEHIGHQVEGEWNVSDAPGRGMYGDDFRVTITVQKV